MLPFFPFVPTRRLAGALLLGGALWLVTSRPVALLALALIVCCVLIDMAVAPSRAGLVVDRVFGAGRGCRRHLGRRVPDPVALAFALFGVLVRRACRRRSSGVTTGDPVLARRAGRGGVAGDDCGGGTGGSGRSGQWCCGCVGWLALSTV